MPEAMKVGAFSMITSAKPLISPGSCGASSENICSTTVAKFCTLVPKLAMASSRPCPVVSAPSTFSQLAFTDPRDPVSVVDASSAATPVSPSSPWTTWIAS